MQVLVLSMILLDFSFTLLVCSSTRTISSSLCSWFQFLLLVWFRFGLVRVSVRNYSLFSSSGSGSCLVFVYSYVSDERF